MAKDDRKERAQRLAEKGVEKYGTLAAVTGHSRTYPKFYSSGVPTLDYMLGTGGFPDNGFVEIFGPPEIGKTSVLGFGILKSVQKSGGITALIATEPNVDEDWMERNGVNPDYNVIYRPDTGEEAFEILKELVYTKDVDYVLYDSLAGTSSQKAQDSDKPQAFGNANLITNGVNNVRARAYKNRVGVCFINQVRDQKNHANLPILKSPGGHAVKHHTGIRLQIKPGKNQYKVRVPSVEPGKATEELVVGRELRVVIAKDNYAEQLGNQAVFDYYSVETADYPFGIDYYKDLFNAAKVAGVIQGSGWLNNDVFPDGKIQGAGNAIAYLEENPDAEEAIKLQVAEAMSKREAQKSAKAPKSKKA